MLDAAARQAAEARVLRPSGQGYYTVCGAVRTS
jgi:hypothetical protein